MKIKEIIEDEFNKIASRHNIILCYDMPKGYENAFGTFDVVKKTLFLNKEKCNSEKRFMFTFYHELRHIYQYLNLKKFNRAIKESLKYVINYNGDCYKLINNEWKSCNFEDKNVDFLNLYKNLPYEIDANKYAYKKCKKIFKNSKELKEIYYKSLYNKKINKNYLNNIFKIIDELTFKGEN